MAYSTADTERIVRLEAATRAAKKIVERARAENHVLVESCERDQPAAMRTGSSAINRSSTLTVYETHIRRPDLFGG